jgi:hypothetical protein
VTVYADFRTRRKSRIPTATPSTQARSTSREVTSTSHATRRGLLTLVPPDIITNDSLFRIKYAYFQFNLDDWMTKGSYVKFGIHQTPLLDYTEGISRYRFQGTTFTEREDLYNSADAGASMFFRLPSNYGEIHDGVYNGEGSAETDPNDPTTSRRSLRVTFSNLRRRSSPRRRSRFTDRSSIRRFES